MASFRKSREILTEDDSCRSCGKIKHKKEFRWVNSYRRSDCKKCESAKSTLSNRLRKYGVNVAEYNEMLREQDNLCYICNDIERYHGTLSVDHNHETGEIRKLLCNSCNRMLGLAKEDIGILKAMISYLEEH